jgi:hypothetical protein
MYCTLSITSPPPLCEQLILELKVGVESVELFSIDPACPCCRPFNPMHQQLNEAPGDSTLLDGCRSETSVAMT